MRPRRNGSRCFESKFFCRHGGSTWFVGLPRDWKKGWTKLWSFWFPFATTGPVSFGISVFVDTCYSKNVFKILNFTRHEQNLSSVLIIEFHEIFDKIPNEFFFESYKFDTQFRFIRIYQTQHSAVISKQQLSYSELLWWKMFKKQAGKHSMKRTLEY